MGNIFVRGPVREVRIEATVLGPCKHCATGAEWWPTTACTGQKHEPTFTRPLGAISRWHKNPLVRAWWKLGDTLRGR